MMSHVGRPVTEVIHGSPLRQKPSQPPPTLDNEADAAASVVSDGASVHSAAPPGEGQGHGGQGLGQGQAPGVGEGMMSVVTDGNGDGSGVEGLGNDMTNSSSQLRAYGLGMDITGIEEKDGEEEEEVVEDQEDGDDDDAVNISEVRTSG